jgi:hypothetical protein
MAGSWLLRGAFVLGAEPAENGVEGGRELVGPIAEVHEQVAGSLSGPGAVGIGGDAKDMDVPASTSRTKNTYRR